MIIYSESKARFQDDVAANRIADRILKLFKEKNRRSVGENEFRSWQNSMLYMRNILDDDEIPENTQVSIEYTLPQRSKRIDFILAGRDDEERDTAIIVELKQWEVVERTEKDAIVSTYLGGGVRETEHPSYQAWTYAALLRDFNETVQEEDIQLVPCAYLHNCKSPEVVRDPFYAEHLDRAPAFVRGDAEKLQAFIKTHIKYGDSGDLMYRIDRGRIRPSKPLADALLSMLQGNTEFLMIDEQKLVFETALSLADEERTGPKNVLIVEGGPGTGKSVIAINLLVELTARQLVAQYVSRNAAPRVVYESKLTGTFKKSHITNLFRGSGVFRETEPNTFDALIIDEAHRLNEKSGFYGNQGENQIKEAIAAARLSVFFVDEDQRVTIKDIGTKAAIRDWAVRLGASVHELELRSQFRCNGSEGYLGWVDHALQIRETANTDLQDVDYEFAVCDTASELRDRIREKNRASNMSRLVAGYCWDWKSKKDPGAMDIEFPGTDFAMQWNLDKDGSLWIVMPESVNQVGCIHTCQGLELDYVGVIIGPDFVIRDGNVEVDASERSSRDSSVRGLKKMTREDPEGAAVLAERVVKNTYRTLLTRGQKGCFVYCTDAETREYFRSFLAGGAKVSSGLATPYEGLPLEILTPEKVQPYVNSVPVFDLQVAAGSFSDPQTWELCDWVSLPEPLVAQAGYFVARVVGESMNRRIANGSWCLFRRDPGGSREGKIVLVEHRDIQDPDFGGGLTVKTYHSTKIENDDGTWRHDKIVLRPQSRSEGYQEIVLRPDGESGVEVVGVLVSILA